MKKKLIYLLLFFAVLFLTLIIGENYLKNKIIEELAKNDLSVKEENICISFIKQELKIVSLESKREDKRAEANLLKVSVPISGMAKNGTSFKEVLMEGGSFYLPYFEEKELPPVFVKKLQIKQLLFHLPPNDFIDKNPFFSDITVNDLELTSMMFPLKCSFHKMKGQGSFCLSKAPDQNFSFQLKEGEGNASCLNILMNLSSVVSSAPAMIQNIKFNSTLKSYLPKGSDEMKIQLQFTLLDVELLDEKLLNYFEKIAANNINEMMAKNPEGLAIELNIVVDLKRLCQDSSKELERIKLQIYQEIIKKLI